MSRTFFDPAYDNISLNTAMERLLRDKLRQAQVYIQDLEHAALLDNPKLKKASDVADLTRLCEIIERSATERMDSAQFNNFIFETVDLAKRVNRPKENA